MDLRRFVFTLFFDDFRRGTLEVVGSRHVRELLAHMSLTLRYHPQLLEACVVADGTFRTLRARKKITVRVVTTRPGCLHSCCLGSCPCQLHGVFATFNITGRSLQICFSICGWPMNNKQVATVAMQALHQTSRVIIHAAVVPPKYCSGAKPLVKRLQSAVQYPEDSLPMVAER
eukprot:4428519-Amphidinium_carterae.1